MALTPVAGRVYIARLPERRTRVEAFSGTAVVLHQYMGVSSGLSLTMRT